MTAHYFIGIKCPPILNTVMNTYTSKYHLSEIYKVIPHADDLHMTLLYIGALPEPSLPHLIKKLRLIADVNPSFTIGIDGLSYFGSPLGPRVVYLSVEESELLTTLQKEIDQIVADQLEQPISDRFTPHITIAKKRKTTGQLFIQKEQWEPIEMRVSSFILFTIHPEKSPKYEAVETFKLS